MVSSFSPRLKISTNTVERPDLWYHRYGYCLRFYINEGSVLRYRDHDMIDRMIARRKEWGRRMAHVSQPGTWVWKELEITDLDLKNLHSTCDFLLKLPQEHKIMVWSNWIYIYTNDVGISDDIAALQFLDPARMSISQVRLIGNPNTVVQKNPKYAKRSFFRNMPITPAQLSGMRNYLLNQDLVRISPALKYALDRESISRCMDYFFIDHDDDSALIMLSLIVPNLIRKTLPIQAYK